MEWEPYDPQWLVKLAEEQMPEEPELAQALAACTRCTRESAYMVYFVAPSFPNQPGSAWQFDENVILEDPQEGDLVLDVLKDGRIGGVEFLTKLCAASPADGSDAATPSDAEGREE